MAESAYLFKPCLCHVCKRLHSSFYSLLRYDDQAVSDARVSLLIAINALHVVHCPEHYRIDTQNTALLPSDSVDETSSSPERGNEGDTASDEGHFSARGDSPSPTSNDESGSAPPPRGSERHYHGKFMVCDHCRGHALPCDEAPVCTQCQLSETPCVHRLCENSPNSREACTDPECRYAHTDYLPTPDWLFSTAYYVIMPGKLRPYLAGGQAVRKDWANHDHDACPAWKMDAQARERQGQVRKDFNRWVQEGLGTLETLYSYCGPKCSKFNSGTGEDEDGGPEDSD